MSRPGSSPGFHWFGDVCIRPERIVAFSESLSGETDVVLRDGTQLRSRLTPPQFAAEVEKAVRHG